MNVFVRHNVGRACELNENISSTPLNMHVRSCGLQYIEMNCVDPDWWQMRIAASTALSVVTPNCLNAVMIQVFR